MTYPAQRCRHGRPATFVNIHNGELACDLDERLLRGTPAHEALGPREEVDLDQFRPRPPQTPVVGLPEPVRPSAALRVDADTMKVRVSYAQVYLRDGNPFPVEPVIQPGGVGLISSRPGCAVLLTGLHTGHVGFTVAVATEDPGPDLSYEDIVETDFVARTGELMLDEWGGSGRHPLPRLPAGPGNLRLRYHGRGLDAAHAGGVVMAEDPVVDTYLLQIWPAPPAPPAILKVTSQSAAYRQSPS